MITLAEFIADLVISYKKKKKNLKWYSSALGLSHNCLQYVADQGKADRGILKGVWFQNHQMSNEPWYSDMIRIYVICWPCFSTLTQSNAKKYIEVKLSTTITEKHNTAEKASMKFSWRLVDLRSFVLVWCWCSMSWSTFIHNAWTFR